MVEVLLQQVVDGPHQPQGVNCCQQIDVLLHTHTQRHKGDSLMTAMTPNPAQMGSNYIRKPLMAFPLEQLQPQTIQPRIPEISIHINEMIFFKVGMGHILLKVKYKDFEKFLSTST